MDNKNNGALQAKQIHLTEHCIKKLSHQAIDKGMDLKNYIQSILEEMPVTIKPETKSE